MPSNIKQAVHQVKTFTLALSSLLLKFYLYKIHVTYGRRFLSATPAIPTVFCIRKQQVLWDQGSHSLSLISMLVVSQMSKQRHLSPGVVSQAGKDASSLQFCQQSGNNCGEHLQIPLAFNKVRHNFAQIYVTQTCSYSCKQKTHLVLPSV